MYKLYLAGFRVGSRKQMNEFVSDVVCIAKDYINYLVYKNKLYLPEGLTSYDCAIDVTAELFNVEKDVFTVFASHFKKIKPKPKSEKDFTPVFKSYICSIVQNNLLNIYKINNPVTFKLLRNIKNAYKDNGYTETFLFTDKYIHRKPVDFNSAECMDKEHMLKLFLSNNGINDYSATELLELLFKIIEEQNEYLHTVAVSDVLYIYKEISAVKTAKLMQNEIKSDEIRIHYKFLIQDIKKNFILKIKKYFCKKNFSENECSCIYKIVDEVLNNYVNGEERDSVRVLVEKYYTGTDKPAMANKAEYVINLLNSEFIANIEREDRKNVRQLN
jgi:hypothetical protein